MTTEDQDSGSITHFVGFTGDEFHRAIRVFGKPHYIHIVWDRRAMRDIAPWDRVIFAVGTENDIPKDNGSDIYEEGEGLHPIPRKFRSKGEKKHG